MGPGTARTWSGSVTATAMGVCRSMISISAAMTAESRACSTVATAPPRSAPPSAATESASSSTTRIPKAVRLTASAVMASVAPVKTLHHVPMTAPPVVTVSAAQVRISSPAPMTAPPVVTGCVRGMRIPPAAPMTAPAVMAAVMPAKISNRVPWTVTASRASRSPVPGTWMVTALRIPAGPTATGTSRSPGKGVAWPPGSPLFRSGGMPPGHR